MTMFTINNPPRDTHNEKKSKKMHEKFGLYYLNT